MTKQDVLTLLEENQNPKGIASWEKVGVPEWSSVGIGLTQLRKLAKKVGKDHELAQELWGSSVYEAKVIGLLIDPPKAITEAQAEAQVGEVSFWMLSHVFCSCDAPLAKSPIAKDMCLKWMASDDTLRRRCGYLLLSELAKNKKDKSLDDAFFLPHVARIQADLQNEENFVRDAMNTSLFTMGQRSKALNEASIAAAKAIGPVEVDYGANSCKPVDVIHHLTGDRIQKKFK